MQKIIDWAKKNEDKINGYLSNKDYTKLLNAYYDAIGYSLTKTASLFKCSRRAMSRYLDGSRMVPMYIIDMMLKEMQIDLKEPKHSDNIVETNDEGLFIWYGCKSDLLFNTLYAYRTLRFNQTRFQAACMLNINENTLYEYESGLRKISQLDIKKVLDIYNLKIDELFPALVSYDGRKTFLPLRPVIDLFIDGNKYDLAEELYVNDDNDIVNTWPTFPVQRYDDIGKPLLKYMPDELTVDEYINSCEECFLDEDSYDTYEMDVSGLNLPPNYAVLFSLTNGTIDVDMSKRYIGYHYIVSNLAFLDDYKISFRVKYRPSVFSLEDYVYSDSPWYSMLQDEDYFKKGRLQFIGEQIPENQCILWPDGQYVRIIELFIVKYKSKKYFTYPVALGVSGSYDRWTIYRRMV